MSRIWEVAGPIYTCENWILKQHYVCVAKSLQPFVTAQELKRVEVAEPLTRSGQQWSHFSWRSGLKERPASYLQASNSPQTKSPMTVVTKAKTVSPGSCDGSMKAEARPIIRHVPCCHESPRNRCSAQSWPFVGASVVAVVYHGLYNSIDAMKHGIIEHWVNFVRCARTQVTTSEFIVLVEDSNTMSLLMCMFAFPLFNRFPSFFHDARP